MPKRLDAALRGLLLAAAIGSGPLAAASGASAASFDCGRAAIPAETAICGNANLSRLDDSTAGMYLLIVGSGAPPATLARVKEAQARFLQSRNACGANIDCLVDAYTSQMMFLRNEKSNLGL